MTVPRLPARLVSGGQTGVDRAALDVSLEIGIPCGGWVPAGRLAEDGPLPPRYPMVEAPSAEYAERTRLNVRDSDATLILTRGTPTGGTALTVAFARELGRPFHVADLAAGAEPAGVRAWIAEAGARTLNVAGPRESTAPGIGDEAARFLRRVLGDGA